VAQAAGGVVEIVVTDRGPGVPEDVRARMFQPFLTDSPDTPVWGCPRSMLRAHPGASSRSTIGRRRGRHHPPAQHGCRRAAPQDLRLPPPAMPQVLPCPRGRRSRFR
jgi:hypothetical protein